MNNRNVNPIHKKNWYHLTSWDHLAPWFGSPHTLPVSATNQSVILHGTLSGWERPCGSHSQVTLPWYRHPLPGGRPRWRKWKILFKQGDCQLPTLWRPPSSTAIPLLAFRDAPASRLPGQLASSLRNRSPAELGTWTTNSNDSNKIPIGS